MYHFIRLSVGLSTILVFAIFVASAGATAMEFQVRAGEEVEKPLGLAAEDHVTIIFAVVGGQTGSTINFYLVCPNGTIQAAFNKGSVDYGFISDVDGEFIMRFSNIGFSEDKLVSLGYEVGHYILGVPQMLFLAIVVVLVCVVMVAAFILTGRRY